MRSWCDACLHVAVTDCRSLCLSSLSNSRQAMKRYHPEYLPSSAGAVSVLLCLSENSLLHLLTATLVQPPQLVLLALQHPQTLFIYGTEPQPTLPDTLVPPASPAVEETRAMKDLVHLLESPLSEEWGYSDLPQLNQAHRGHWIGLWCMTHLRPLLVFHRRYHRLVVLPWSPCV